MKILSWNVLWENKKIDAVFNSLMNANFDIACLQEVPEILFERLLKTDFAMAHAVGWDMVHDIQRKKVTRFYNVILTRFPILSQNSFALPLLEDVPWRGRLTKKLFELTGAWTTIHHRENRNGVKVEVETPEFGRIQVLCAHLSVPRPEWRDVELGVVFKQVGSSFPAVVCGDFNILETWWTTPMTWLMGGRIKDAVFCKSERTRLEKRFASLNLKNPLCGKVTHHFSQSQLDHVLVPKAFSVEKAYVMDESYGSDHYPVCVDVTSLRS